MSQHSPTERGTFSTGPLTDTPKPGSFTSVHFFRTPGLNSFASRFVTFLPTTPSSPMDAPLPDLRPGGVDLSLPTCEATQCNGHGDCVPPPDGGTGLVCDCHLGYRGEFCDDTVNGALSLPLTLSVIAVIIGLLILAFIVAKMRQRQKKNRRKHLAAKHGYNIAV